jgi:hypothetical protein
VQLKTRDGSGGRGQSTAEAGEGGVIWCGLAEGKAKEGFEGESVVDLILQLGIGLNTEPRDKPKKRAGPNGPAS